MLGLLFTIALVVILAAIAYGYLGPDKVHVERDIVIDASPERVFALVSSFPEWEKWSPWGGIDPNTEYRYSGSGVGHRMDWKSEHREVGSGAQEIVELDAPRKMVSDLDFGEMGQARATFDIEPVDAGTAGPSCKVTWSLDANMREGVPALRQPMATFFGFFMDRMMDKPYREGLANLKSMAEAGASAQPEPARAREIEASAPGEEPGDGASSDAAADQETARAAAQTKDEAGEAGAAREPDLPDGEEGPPNGPARPTH